MKQILSMLSKFIPINLAAQGLEKLDPRFKKFFYAAAAAGYGADQAMDFLRNRIGKQGDGQLTPEEETANIEAQRSYAPHKLAAGLGGAALGGTAGAALAGSSEFLKKGAASEKGLAEDLTKQIGGPEPKKLINAPPEIKQIQSQPNWTMPTEEQEPIRSYNPFAGLQKFPALAKFVQEHASQGLDAITISQKARQNAKIGQMVKAVEEEANSPFEEVLKALIPESLRKQGNAKNEAPPESELISAIRELRKWRSGANG